MTSGKASADVLKDLAPTGVLRAAINFGNVVLAQRDPASGEPRGLSVDLACELGRRLGVQTKFVTFDAAGKVFAAIADGAWDVAFLAADPTRAAEILFTSPYVLIEATYLVRDDSPLKQVEDVDREGVRIAVGKGTAYELFLTRNLQHARLERRASGAEAFAAFIDEGLEVIAGVREVVENFAKRRPGLRVMDGRFMAIAQALGTLQGRAAGARYLQLFIEEMTASGFVAEALKRSGQSAVVVSPPG